MLKKIQYIPNVWIVYSESSEEIGRAFIRFTEYCESVKFKNDQNLTVKAIEEWWKSTEKGKELSYYEYWEGHNITGKVLLTFKRNPSLHPITKHEQHVFDLFADVEDKDLEKADIIAFPTTNNVVIDHEIAHVWFSVDPAYKSTQIYNISQINKQVFESLRKELISMGYDKSVVIDEIQAYMSTYIDTLNETFSDLQNLNLHLHTGPFVATFKQYEQYRPIPKIGELI